MEDNKEFDTGIVGCSELEEALNEVERLKEKVRVLEQDNDDLQDDLGCANNEIDDLESRLETVINNYDPMGVRNQMLDNLVLKLNQDGLMTKELDEWLELYRKFYMGEL